MGEIITLIKGDNFAGERHCLQIDAMAHENPLSHPNDAIFMPHSPISRLGMMALRPNEAGSEAKLLASKKPPFSVVRLIENCVARRATARFYLACLSATRSFRQTATNDGSGPYL